MNPNNVFHSCIHFMYTCVCIPTQALSGSNIILVLSEELYRFEVFKSNMAKAKVLQEAEQATAKYGATFFADMTGNNHPLRLKIKIISQSMSSHKH